MKEIRIESKVKNNILWHAIYDNYGNVNKFCKISGFRPSEICKLMNLKVHIWCQRTGRSKGFIQGKYKSLCIKLANFFNVLPEDLFPTKLYDTALRCTTSIVHEFGVDQLPTVCYHELPASEEYEPETIYIKEELLKNIENSLNSLTSFQREVLKLRFGLEDGIERTSVEVGKELNVSASRIRQIQNRSLRILRHPARSKNFKDNL